LKFQGAGMKEPFHFLKRLLELMEAYRMSDTDMLAALPEILLGQALLWYCNKKSELDSWSTFLSSFKSR
jgi:hypothetical protein